MRRTFIQSLGLLPGVLLGLTSLATPAQDNKVQWRFANSQEQVVQGQSSRIVAYGDQLTIQSLEITPSDGLTIQGLSEQPPDPKKAPQNEKGVRVWSFVVLADKTAQPGERSVVAVTPQGRSYPRTILVVTHEPVISNLEVVSTNSSGTVNVRFEVTDTEGDVTPKAPPSVTAFLDCSNYMLFSATEADKVVMKDAKHATVYHQATFGSPGRELEIQNGYCMLRLSIRDAGSIESNTVEVRAEFKQPAKP